MTCDVIVPGMVIVQTVQRICEMGFVINEIKKKREKERNGQDSVEIIYVNNCIS